MFWFVTQMNDHRTTNLCLACDVKQTIRAHLIPLAFTNEVRAGDQQLALTNGSTFRANQSGLFDDSILCRECDNRLGKHENYACQTLRRLRDETSSQLNTYVQSPASGDRLIRFAAGISWKYCVTRPHYGCIDVGPYVGLLKQVALGDDDISPSINMFMIRLKAIQFEERFFRAPMPDRQFGVNFVRLTLGAFLMFLKIDKRSPPRIGNPEVWMRGRSEVVFPVCSMNMFEEGRIVTEGWKHNRKLENWLFDSKFWSNLGQRKPAPQ